MISLHTDVSEIENLLKQFWEVESLPDITKNSTTEQFTDEDNYCESFFSQTHYIDPVTQRYVVRLPFEEDSPSLGNSINQAMSCFKSLEKRFQSNQYLLQEYTNFMEEYEKLGHMEPIPADVLSTNNEHMYLPHHAVIKPTNITTKVLVVFNGSAKTDNGTSLNQKMVIGPKTQRDLLLILLSFRTYEIAVVADIEKMYRQILVDPQDRNFQRILWRKHPNQSIQHMWLKTVTYGTSAAPYLTARALNQLPIEFKDEFPLAEQSIKNNFYVDDFLGGAANEEQAFELCKQLSTLLNRRGFNLRKWASNSQHLMHLLQSHHGTVSCARIDSRFESFKVLEMQWLPSNDIFSYEVMTSQFERLTKRLILSESSKLFDPLGLVSPVTITFKILIQQLLLKNYDWDEHCIDLEEKWNTLYKQLHYLQNIQIPRFINNRAEPSDIEIHGFADVSEAAYAAVIYCRISNTSATPNVVIVMAKTKVCPIKQLSIPRLELCAAVLLTKLMKFVQQNLNISSDRCFAWSDSAIVLAWLSNNPRKWNTFVSNKTSFILDTLPRSQWNHIPSTQNPADLASRGLSAKKLQQSSLWWTGPDWLVNNWREKLKHFNYNSHTPHEQRKRYIENFHTQIKEHLLTHLFNKFSEFSYIIRILRRCFHFTKNCSKENSQKTSWTTAEDQMKAMHVCILWVQSEAFHDEINNIKTTHSIRTSIHISLHNRWRLLQQTHQHFWKQWSHEYLSTLQRRPKWQRVEQNLKTGDMVVVKEPNLMAAKWMLGRIENVHPGKDNIVRVATVRTTHGTFKRPVVKLCKLPID